MIHPNVCGYSWIAPYIEEQYIVIKPSMIHPNVCGHSWVAPYIEEQYIKNLCYELYAHL